MKLAFILLLCALCTVRAEGAGEVNHSFVPKSGFVPDEATAVSVAIAVLIPIYGKENVYGQQPFKAILNGENTWIVRGSLPANTPGGTARIEITKADGRIISVTHSK